MPLINPREEAIFIVHLSGSLDSETYTQLETSLKPLLNPSTKAIVFDLKELNFISSLGLSVIFKTKSALEKNNGKLLITNLQPQIKKVFEVVKVIPESLFVSMEEADNFLDKFLRELEENK